MDKTVFISFFVSFLLTALLLKLLIPILLRLKFGQRILEIGPSWHASKQGTPTMGGIAFIICGTPLMLLFFSVELAKTGKADVPLLASTLYILANGLIGLTDDFVKLRKKQNEGLKAFTKYALMLIAAAVYLAVIRGFGAVSTEIYIPFLQRYADIGGFYYPFALLFLTGFSNAVNLTDGLDGLCSSVTAAVALFFSVLSLRFASYSGAVISLITLGVCLGFLIYNFHPARVFMGDTGSLFLGSAVSSVCLCSRANTVLFIVGGIYLLEAVSVILQVLYYKLTGKRLFLMAPFHHHLEKKGIKETSVTACFAGVTVLLCALAYILA